MLQATTEFSFNLLSLISYKIPGIAKIGATVFYSLQLRNKNQIGIKFDTNQCYMSGRRGVVVTRLI